MQGNPVRPVLAAACTELDIEGGWRLDDEPQPFPGAPGTPEEPWVGVRHVGARVPAQGWKLHVSASVDEAFAVLARVLPVLLAEPVSFKVAASVEALAILNAGAGGRTQAGKFITVYPTDDAQAVRLAVALDRATAGGRGPRVPSDRPLRPGSLVHYRYGAFVPRWVQTNLGEVAPAVEAPDGALVPDRRTQGYARPPWAPDPFVAAGVVERHPPVDLFVAGRYLTAEVLSSTPELNVRLVVDTVAGCRRVLKHARGRAGAVPGQGPVARLRHEAAVLGLLAGDPCVPAVHDVFEDGDDLFVVLEHCEGRTLEQEMGLRSSSGQSLPPEHLRRWACTLADAVGRMHDRGLVYGDLKSPHVIVGPEGSIRLVDLESVWPNPDPQGAVVLGTPGYLSPQRAAMVEPSPADDVYGLGALLFFLATGAEPSHAPDRRRLLDRPVEVLNPGVPADVASLIVRCLDPVVEGRPSSMAEVTRLLRTCPATAAPPAPEPGREPASVARQLALRLCRTAVEDGDSGTVTWPADDADPMPPPRDVNGGAAGVVLALAGAAPMLDEAEVWWALDRSAQWLVASEPLPGGPHPGLYVGESGIGAALLRAGQALGDPVLVAAAEAKGRLVAALPHASPDLFNGSAGRLRFHLMLWQATGHDEHLAAARHAGDVLLTTAGEHWPIPAGYESASGRVYVGYAHGSAGIADALLDLYEATGDERLAATVAAAGTHLLAAAVPCLDDASGLNWPGEYGGGPAAPLWCHGAAGVARFLLHAARLDAVPGAAAAAEAASRSVGGGARWVGPSQCHGLAGNVDVLVDAFQVTADPSFLAEARHLGRLLEAYLVEPDDLYPRSPGAVRSADLMTGWAGLLACYLRLTAPTTSAHVLSLAASPPRAGPHPRPPPLSWGPCPTTGREPRRIGAVERRTKIVATIGPASEDPTTLDRLVAAGMNMARLSLAHGPVEETLERIKRVRAAAAKAGATVGILADLPGPKVRAAAFLENGVYLNEGETLELVPAGPGAQSDRRRIAVDLPDLLEQLRPGDMVALGDGGIRFAIDAVDGDRAVARILTGGLVRGRPGIALPASRFAVRTPTAEDLRLLEILCAAGVEAVAISFVRSAADVERVRAAAGPCAPMLVAKIETQEAVDALEEVIPVSDGVMVARGDLGIRCSLEDVPHYQKRIIRMGVAYGRPVITATQMLESMITAPTPTRAEVSDVANAVFDGTSALMLSGETAIGHDPVAAVLTMSSIAVRAEREFDYYGWGSNLGAQQVAETQGKPAPIRITAALSAAAWRAATDAQAAAIIACTNTGATARAISRFRPTMPILAATPSERAARQLSVAWGITPLVVERQATTDDIVWFAIKAAVDQGIVHTNDVVAVLVGSPLDPDPASDVLRLVRIR